MLKIARIALPLRLFVGMQNWRDRVHAQYFNVATPCVVLLSDGPSGEGDDAEMEIEPEDNAALQVPNHGLV